MNEQTPQEVDPRWVWNGEAWEWHDEQDPRWVWNGNEWEWHERQGVTLQGVAEAASIQSPVTGPRRRPPTLNVSVLLAFLAAFFMMVRLGIELFSWGGPTWFFNNLVDTIAGSFTLSLDARYGLAYELGLILEPAVWLLFIVSGIGLVGRKNWARVLAMIASIVYIVLYLYTWVAYFLLIVPAQLEEFGAWIPFDLSGWIHEFFSFLVGATAVALVILVNSKSLKAATRRS